MTGETMTPTQRAIKLARLQLAERGELATFPAITKEMGNLWGERATKNYSDGVSEPRPSVLEDALKAMGRALVLGVEGGE